jgi:hypothetical protein
MLELVLVFSVAMLSLAECGVQSFIDTRDHFAAVCLIVGWTIQVSVSISIFSHFNQRQLSALWVTVRRKLSFSINMYSGYII